MPSSLLRGVTVASCILMLLLLGGSTAIALSHEQPGPFGSLLFNADALYLPLFIQEVQTGGIDSLSGWVTPPANCFFPDGLLMLTARLAVHDPILSVFAYALIQLFLFAWIGYLLSREISPATPRTSVIFCTLASVTIVLLAGCYEQGSYNLSLALVSGYHLGSFLVALFNIYLFVKHVRTGNQVYLWLCITSTSLALFSDTLHAIHFSLPFGITLLVIFKTANQQMRRAAIKLALGIVSSPLVAALLERLIRRATGITFFHLELFETLTGGISKGHLDLPALAKGYNPWIETVPGPIALIALVWYGYLCFWRPTAQREEGDQARNVPAHVFKIYSISLFVLLLVFPIVTGLSGMNVTRYTTPFFLLPFLFIHLPALGLFSLGTRPFASLATSGLVMLLFLCLVTVMPTNLNSPDRNPLVVQNQMQCILDVAKRHSIRIGFGDYWIAKPASFFSRNALRILQLEANMMPHYWISNYHWYFELEKYPGNKIVVTRGLNRAPIVQHLGNPSLVETCEGMELLVYRGPELGAVDRFGESLIQQIRVWEKLTGRRPYENVR
ncbi:MAG: hypothetical protein K8S54_14295 [Spirochaetia bacterium]|nr:hypothetical protein [Spirochaetia bacterium]